VAAVLAVLALVAGCSAGQQAATSNHRTNAGGNGGKAGEIAVRNALITYDRPVPGGEVYAVGQAAPLQVTIINTGVAADRLVAVSSPVAAAAQITGETTMPGGHVLTAGYTDPLAAVTLPKATSIGITLGGLTSPLRAGLTYPVTFAFERGGTVTLELPLGYPEALPPRVEEPVVVAVPR
jgi:copper(I)-binding protein